jgi:hypothetical protein
VDRPHPGALRPPIVVHQSEEEPMDSNYLSDEKLAELLDLLKEEEVDGVEFKLTVPENERFSSASKLGMDPLKAQIRQIYFFDTPDLRLRDKKLVVRARRVQGEADDSVIKLRQVVPDRLPNELRESRDFKVEIDAMPDGFLCSGSFKEEFDSKDIPAVLAGDKGLQSLFSKDQRDFYAANAPSGLGLNDLAILGPILVLKYQFTPKGFPRELDGEMWIFPDGSNFLEVSTKCPPLDYFSVEAETRAFLSRLGIKQEANQETKTNKALELFAALLQKGDGA